MATRRRLKSYAGVARALDGGKQTLEASRAWEQADLT